MMGAMALVGGRKSPQALNVTPRRVQQLVEEGLPRAAYGQYDLGQAMAWYIRHLQAALERREIPQVDAVAAALRGERQLLTTAQADLAEAELGEKRGELIPLQLFEERMSLMITSARQRIVLPSRIAPELEGLNRDEIKRKPQATVHIC
jgi:phage terminase Nu1 subunit (DNA packaging protein)